MKLFFISIPVFCILFLTACHSINRNKEIDRYLDKEIRDRMQVIVSQPDSLYISPLRINNEVNNFLLMTKDVENIPVTISRINHYFNDLAAIHHLDALSFARLDPAMDPDEMASHLKENELSFFNQLIFKSNPPGNSKIYTAH